MFQMILRVYLLLCLCWSSPVFCQEYEAVIKQIPHIDNPEKQVEFYALFPRLKAKLPVIIFVHGYQDDKAGAKTSFGDGTLEHIVEQGYIAVSVSQPGFGYSSGPPDYCGLFTQQAIVSVIQYLKNEYSELVDPQKIVLWGRSRGAIVISNIATRDSSLAGLILEGGMYDMRTATYEGVIKHFKKEAGSSEQAIQERSALFKADKIKMPVLMFHGYYDDRSPIQQAIQFYEAILKAGSKATLIIFPSGHRVPTNERRMLIRQFLKNIFEKKYETSAYETPKINSTLNDLQIKTSN